ncbi:MAG: hypothetical protein JO112_05340 [Planctomycetes bacterium]|nr:hypothetical protein [Planctomycetota bacterium]
MVRFLMVLLLASFAVVSARADWDPYKDLRKQEKKRYEQWRKHQREEEKNYRDWLKKQEKLDRKYYERSQDFYPPAAPPAPVYPPPSAYPPPLPVPYDGPRLRLSISGPRGSFTFEK